MINKAPFGVHKIKYTMRIIGTMVMPENGAEAFDLACEKAKRSYSVERAITGYLRLLCDGQTIHDDPACEDVQEEDNALYFFAELIKEREKK